MTALYPYKIKENYSKRKAILNDQLYDLNDLPEFLLRQRNPNPLKKLLKKLRRLKRVSPFLIIAFCLPTACGLFCLTQIQIGWITVFSFVFLPVNVLFIDFVLWNYHEGKRWFAIINNIPPFIY